MQAVHSCNSWLMKLKRRQPREGTDTGISKSQMSAQGNIGGFLGGGVAGVSPNTN